jgi:hypothetical protein
MGAFMADAKIKNALKKVFLPFEFCLLNFIWFLSLGFLMVVFGRIFE